MECSKFKTIRIRAEDYEALVKINAVSQIPIVRLVHLSVATLKEKYEVTK